jgi:hypothetical protein
MGAKAYILNIPSPAILFKNFSSASVRVPSKGKKRLNKAAGNGI